MGENVDNGEFAIGYGNLLGDTQSCSDPCSLALAAAPGTAAPVPFAASLPLAGAFAGVKWELAFGDAWPGPWRGRRT